MADVTKSIAQVHTRIRHGYATDTREYADEFTTDIPNIREFTTDKPINSIRGAISKIIKVHTDTRKYAD